MTIKKNRVDCCPVLFHGWSLAFPFVVRISMTCDGRSIRIITKFQKECNEYKEFTEYRIFKEYNEYSEYDEFKVKKIH